MKLPDITADDVRTAATVGSVLVASTAVWFARRSSKSAAESARNSKRSADNSERSADTAGEALKLQRRQRHEALAPAKPAAIETTQRETATAGGSAFGTFTVGRDYRVRAERVFRGGGTSRLSLDLVLRASEVHEFEVDRMAPDREDLDVVEIKFHFWPPVESDPVEHWTCPCGLPTNDEDGPGHWFFTVPVKPPPNPFFGGAFR